MKTFKNGWLLFLLILTDCRTTKPTIEVGRYMFTYNDLTYRIESVTPSNMEGYNILSRQEKEHFIFKAIDKEQNGTLNEVLIGDLTLEEANSIYQVGIKEGERLGYIKKRTFAREYRTFDILNNYVLATYLLAVGEVYNKFRITNKQILSGETVVIDLDADGKLDKVEKGDMGLNYYQKYYDDILKRGLIEMKIEKRDGLYIVIL